MTISNMLLTPEQELKFHNYLNKWINIGIGKYCNEIDLELCKYYARMAYSTLGYKCPERFYIAHDPNHALDILKSIGIEFDVNNPFDGFVFAKNNALWICVYEFIQVELGINKFDFEGQKGLTINCGSWYPDVDFMIFTRKHDLCNFDEQIISSYDYILQQCMLTLKMVLCKYVV